MRRGCWWCWWWSWCWWWCYLAPGFALALEIARAYYAGACARGGLAGVASRHPPTPCTPRPAPTPPPQSAHFTKVHHEEGGPVVRLFTCFKARAWGGPGGCGRGGASRVGGRPRSCRVRGWSRQPPDPPRQPPATRLGPPGLHHRPGRAGGGAGRGLTRLGLRGREPAASWPRRPVDPSVELAGWLAWPTGVPPPPQRGVRPLHVRLLALPARCSPVPAKSGPRACLDRERRQSGALAAPPRACPPMFGPGRDFLYNNPSKPVPHQRASQRRERPRPIRQGRDVAWQK